MKRPVLWMSLLGLLCGSLAFGQGKVDPVFVGNVRTDYFESIVMDADTLRYSDTVPTSRMWLSVQHAFDSVDVALRRGTFLLTSDWLFLDPDTNTVQSAFDWLDSNWGPTLSNLPPDLADVVVSNAAIMSYNASAHNWNFTNLVVDVFLSLLGNTNDPYRLISDAAAFRSNYLAGLALAVTDSAVPTGHTFNYEAALATLFSNHFEGVTTPYVDAATNTLDGQWASTWAGLRSRTVLIAYSTETNTVLSARTNAYSGEVSWDAFIGDTNLFDVATGTFTPASNTAYMITFSITAGLIPGSTAELAYLFSGWVLKNGESFVISGDYVHYKDTRAESALAGYGVQASPGGSYRIPPGDGSDFYRLGLSIDLDAMSTNLTLLNAVWKIEELY